MNTTAADAAGAGAPAKTGFIAWFAGNSAAANLLMLFLIAGGVLSGIHLAVQNFPVLDTRTVTVTVRLPGSSAKEVEEDINRRVEEAVVGLSGVERVVSTATQGLGRGRGRGRRVRRTRRRAERSRGGGRRNREVSAALARNGPRWRSGGPPSRS